MSRSYRKTPVHGGGSCSEKEDKRKCNRALRRINRCLLAAWRDDALFKDKRQVLDVWVMRKDGKMRFDPEEFPRLMRK